jgi:hypothetical protein
MNVSKLFKSIILFAALVCFGTAAMAQGVTTSALGGRILDANGEALIGANVLAVHTPSGTVYGNSTDLEGYYRIPGMRVGGPYTITVSYTGYEDFKREGIFLTLGQTFQFNSTMQETATELEGIVITSSRADIFDGNRTGQETVIDEKTINEIPTITRAIGDYARFNPLASIGEGGDGFTISLAGQNNRYNAIYIDGAVNNDAFGLAGGGTNGGQTGVQPISIDAIEQFQIAIAPFDVRQSGFAGGSINAVTRSGTNNLEGSAYYFLRNEGLAGDTPGANIETREPLDEFSASTYGFRLGGPIIKNKLFFFVNAEIQRDETPQPFEFSTYNGDATEGDINNLVNFVQDSYGYDVGLFDNNTAFLNSEKFLVKFDYNLNDNNKLSLRHSYVNAENLEARRSSRGSLNFINGSEFFVSQTNSTALELNTLIGSTMSNNLKIGLTIVRDDRDPDGSPFPTVFLEDGDNGSINFGAERFSTANLLNQDIFTINNDFSIYKGRHNLVFGVNFEYFNAGNLFIRNNYGRYRWFNDDDSGMTGLQQFVAGMPATQYERSFSQVDNVAGDESAAIAEFGQMLLGFYAQDEFQVNNDFKLTYGLRIDIPFWPTDQPVNEEFNNTTIPAIESFGYDLKGAQTGQFVDPQLLFSPRVGFNYNVNGADKTQIRGGAGIFTSRLPLVWPGGAYNNYGFNVGEGGGNNVEFEPDVQKQPVMADLDNPVPSGQVDLFAADFKLPQVLKINVAIDHKLPWGLIGTLEGIYTKNINAVRYENLNLKPSTSNLTAGGDTRPLFLGTQAQFGDDVIDPTYTYIMLGSNTSEGYSYNIAATLTRPFTNGFTASLSYSYGDSFNAFDGTSSQNNSQWRGYHSVAGRNFVTGSQRSSFAAGHRIFGQFSYEISYADFGRSMLSLNINAETGGFFSHVVGGRNFLFIDDGGFDNNELYYVPENANEAFLVDTEVDGVTYTAAEQWAILDQFIEDDPHLSDRRGDYAERNGGRIPMQFTADLRFLQDFYIKVGGKKHTLQFTADIFNFTNMLNPEWGILRFAGSFGNYSVVNLRGNTLGGNTTPSYTLNPDIIRGEDPWTDRIDDSGFRSSRWQAQIGVRYIFQ